MSSESDEEGLMNQALPIGDVANNFDPTAPPSTAEEYLQRVIWESQQCEDVITIKLDKGKRRKLDPVVKTLTKTEAPIGYSPTECMRKEFLDKFVDMREKIQKCKASSRMPVPSCTLPSEEDDEEGWLDFCFGSDRVSEPNQPLLSTLLNIDTVTLENLLEWQIDHLSETGVFSEHIGRWMFSLLACLDKPLSPESCSYIRNLIRLCAKLRAALDSLDHPHLPHLNMLITIVVKYFNQEDLADK